MQSLLQRLEGRTTGHRGGLDVALQEGDRGERGVGLRAPWSVAGKKRQELLHLGGRAPDELDELGVRAAFASVPGAPGGLQRETSERLAAGRGTTAFAGDHDGALQVAAHALGITRHRPDHPAPGLELPGPRPRRGRRRGRCRQAEPSLGAFEIAEIEQAQRDPTGGQELDAPVALDPGRAIRVLAARQGQIRHGTFAREQTWTPYSIWKSRRARSLSVTSSERRLVTRRISSRWRAEDEKWRTMPYCA